MGRSFPDDILREILKNVYEKTYIDDIFHFCRGKWNNIEDPLITGARIGSLELIETPLAYSNKYSNDTINSSSYSGIFETHLLNDKQNSNAISLLNEDNPVLYRMMSLASRYGHLNIVEYLLKYMFKEFKASDSYSPDIEEDSKLDSFTYHPDPKITLTNNLNSAAMNGHISVMKVLLNKLKFYYKDTVIKACQYGNISVVKFLKNYHVFEVFPWYSESINEGIEPNILRSVVSSGNQDLVKYLCGDDKGIYDEEFMNSHKEIIFSGLVETNQLDKVSEYMTQYPDLPTKDNTLLLAIKKGYIPLFKYMYENLNCTAPCMDNRFLVEAAKLNNLDLYLYLRSTNGKGSVPLVDNSAFIFGGGDNDVSNHILSTVINHENLPFIKHIIEHENINVEYANIKSIITKDNVNILSYFESINETLFSSTFKSILINACKNRSKKIVDWLFETKHDLIQHHFSTEIVEILTDNRFWDQLYVLLDTSVYDRPDDLNFSKLDIFIRNNLYKYENETLDWFDNNNMKKRHIMKDFYEIIDIYKEQVNHRMNLENKYKICIQEKPSFPNIEHFTFGTEIVNNAYSDLPDDLRIPPPTNSVMPYLP